VWARVVRDAKFEQIKGVLSALHETGAGAGFELPEPIAVVPELSMEVFGHVPGVALVALVDRDEFPALCRRTGEALARFHRVALQAPAAFGIESQLNRLWENATEFSWMMRAEARWIADVASALAERLQASRREPLSLIHRDLHGGNILADGARLCLVDFEDCAIGEPADDVGSNWAHLTWHSNGTGERAERAALARRAFLDGYLENATLPAAVLATYAAMHCFLYAHQCLRHPQDPARDAHARGMLAAAERILDRDLP
jgi:Ser/Thr protein kinase RdoA (MazF antagonist)